MKENKNNKRELTYKLVDLQNQLKALSICEDKIMECGLIYPAIEYIQNAQKSVIEAMKCEALEGYGLDDDIELIFKNSSVNHQWNWYDDFKKWRSETGGIISKNRKQDI